MYFYQNWEKTLQVKIRWFAFLQQLSGWCFRLSRKPHLLALLLVAVPWPQLHAPCLSAGRKQSHGPRWHSSSAMNTHHAYAHSRQTDTPAYCLRACVMPCPKCGSLLASASSDGRHYKTTKQINMTSGFAWASVRGCGCIDHASFSEWRIVLTAVISSLAWRMHLASKQSCCRHYVFVYKRHRGWATGFSFWLRL